MRAGELADAVGVSVQTIHFYERRGLIPAPPRLSSGYRDYPTEMVSKVLFIKQMQELGFTLRELERFIRLLESEPDNPAERRKCVEAKLSGIDDQIRRLQAMRDELSARALTCKCCNAQPLEPPVNAAP
ncbi:MAG TPA: MerR family DNA-binding transcriptional regulator [Blastocatellia bacterium]|nr:MerR family DNA-binding transcriptional regulator [Blastocatellia bacterium]